MKSNITEYFLLISFGFLTGAFIVEPMIRILL